MAGIKITQLSASRYHGTRRYGSFAGRAAGAAAPELGYISRNIFDSISHAIVADMGDTFNEIADGEDSA